MRIRAFTEADVARAAAIQAACYPPGPPTAGQDAASLHASPTGYTTTQLQEELTRPWSRTFISEGPRGDVTGMLIAWFVADEFHLHNVAVDPAARRMGYARQLLSVLLDTAFDAKLTRGFLEVSAHNHAAIALYDAFGALRFGLRKAYYADGSDAVEMAFSLDPAQRKVLAIPLT